MTKTTKSKKYFLRGLCHDCDELCVIFDDGYMASCCKKHLINVRERARGYYKYKRRNLGARSYSL